jgi:putative Mn2+ efflux pump MntP
MFINTLILSISSSIDAIGIGITYGLRKTKFSIASQIIFFLVSFTMTSLSVLLGNFIKNFFSPNFTTFLGAALIICIGLYTIFESFKKQKDFDFDKSNDINLKEALALSLSLTMDSLCIGISGSILGINSYLFPIFVATIHLTFLLIGDTLGKNLVNISKIPNNIWGIISGLLLIIIGFCKFI